MCVRRDMSGRALVTLCESNIARSQVVEERCIRASASCGLDYDRGRSARARPAGGFG